MNQLRIDDCWNRIGVSGDQSCPKLAQAVHCRNCTVFADAAQRNLQRPVGRDYLEQWAAQFRQPRAEDAPTDASALAFRIGREWLALPTALVVSVAPQAPGHRIPHRSSAELLGIVNVGGKLVPSVSLAALLGIDEHDVPPEAGRHRFARLLLATWEGQGFALPVADLHGIVHYRAGALAAPAATINKGLQRYLAGVTAQGALQVGVLDGALLGQQLTRLLR